jgi:hypothetical protein
MPNVIILFFGVIYEPINVTSVKRLKKLANEGVNKTKHSLKTLLTPGVKLVNYFE